MTSSRLIPALNSTFELDLVTTVGPVGGPTPRGRQFSGLIAVAGKVGPGGPPKTCAPVVVAGGPVVATGALVVRVGVGGGGIVPACVAPCLALAPVSPSGL
jgi:hypothetical protein